MIEHVLYGTRKGEPKWKEEIITTNPKEFLSARRWAKKHGFGRFRVAKIDLSLPPDFAGTVRKI